MMKCKIEGDSAILLKEELERMAEHYRRLMARHRSQLRRLFYAGKVDIIVDILKQFENQ